MKRSELKNIIKEEINNILSEKLRDDAIANDIKSGLYTNEELEQAYLWWNNTLSLNNMKELIRKYYPEYDNSTYRYKEPDRVIVDIWKKENKN